jgi:hypothetical protein
MTDVLLRSDIGAGNKSSILRNDHYAIPHDPLLAIDFRAGREGADDDLSTEAGIFVQDGAFDFAIRADAEGDILGFRKAGLVKVGPHQDRVGDAHAVGNLAAQSNNGRVNISSFDVAAISQQHIIKRGAVNAGTRQEA